MRPLLAASLEKKAGDTKRKEKGQGTELIKKKAISKSRGRKEWSRELRGCEKKDLRAVVDYQD